MLKNFDEIIAKAKEKGIKKLAVAAAEDKPVLEAVNNARKEGFIEPVLVGDREKIEIIAKEINMDLHNVEIIDEKTPSTSAKKAIALVREGRAQLLMKGLVGTADLLKPVLNKETGLRKGATLSHVAFFETQFYHKLIAVTDAALNVAPEFKEKIDIIKNSVEAFHKLGTTNPKVAVIGAVESVNPKMEATTHAAMLNMMNKRNQIKNCVIDGPLALDNAVSKEAAEHKGIKSDVAGDADIIMCPDIEAANVLYKSLNFLGGATAAAVLMGATAPIVLTSRADSAKTKLYSIVLACVIS